MIIAGIDPGLTGGIAILSTFTAELLADIPTHQIPSGPRKILRAELDVPSLVLMLASHGVEHVFIERVAARPGQGVTSMFRFGYAAGTIHGVVVALSIPLTFVTPQFWQKHHGCGPAPDAARQRAVQLYPAIAPLLTRKKDGNRADALLIAAYGLWQLSQARAA